MALKYLTPPEMMAFYKIITRPRDSILFKWMGMNGLRVGEVVGEELAYWTYKGKLCGEPVNTDEDDFEDYKFVETTIPGIQLEDIDWNSKTISVLGKGAKIRTVPINREFFPELMDYVKPFDLSPEERKGQLIFKYGGQPISTHQVRNLCRKYAKEAEMGRRVHPHMFRHGFAVQYLKQGGNLRALQMILGHSSLATTELYLQLSAKDLAEDMDKVFDDENILSKSKEQIGQELVRRILG